MAMMNGKRIDADMKMIITNPDLVTSSGADFAEVGFWFDDNPDDEDRLYRFVSIAGATGKEIKIADATSQIVGTSNLYENIGFLGGYAAGDEEDNSKVIVSIVGVVPVKTNDNTIVANDRVMSDDNGYAVKSTNNCGYRVLEVKEGGLLTIVVSPNTDMVQRIKNDMDGKQPKLTAGTNINIDENNVISAPGGGIPSVTIGTTSSKATHIKDIASQYTGLVRIANNGYIKDFDNSKYNVYEGGLLDIQKCVIEDDVIQECVYTIRDNIRNETHEYYINDMCYKYVYPLIEDTTTSTEYTYSSEKIESLISSAIGDVLGGSY